jgi:hypothetical protein
MPNKFTIAIISIEATVPPITCASVCKPSFILAQDTNGSSSSEMKATVPQHTIRANGLKPALYDYQGK